MRAAVLASCGMTQAAYYPCIRPPNLAIGGAYRASIFLKADANQIGAPLTEFASDPGSYPDSRSAVQALMALMMTTLQEIPPGDLIYVGTLPHEARYLQTALKSVGADCPLYDDLPKSF